MGSAYRNAGVGSGGRCRILAIFASLAPEFLDEDVLELHEAGGPAHSPFRLPPWCWSAIRPRAGRSGIVAPGMTTTSVEHRPHGIAPDRDLEPVPLTDRLVGLVPRRDGRTQLGAVLGSVRMPYISPEPMGQHQMLTWYVPDPRR